MLCYCVGWNRGKFKIGQMLNRHVGASMRSNLKGQDRSQSGPAKFTPCIYYNKNACSQNRTHETKGVLYRHICSACWAANNKVYGQSQVDCRRTRSKTSK